MRWGLWQGIHITGTDSPYDFLVATRTVTTRTVSKHVTADVLLIAGPTTITFVCASRIARHATSARLAR
ncbi:hypothetical protein I553_9416 [Mycobacterium xenopi 4042]|uniref:Uncharacterized protein n=1 Tax=Mycobacterium xenopi 4042 TaxID=1299334 RepID=X8E0C0_MYCXE|nr:hypothetical protein I553_9416 [Mycobacterium xenopi 4042]